MKKLTGVLFVLIAFSMVASARADIIRVEQLWYGFQPIGGITNPSITVNTRAVFDDSSITGVGIERVPVSFFDMAVYLNGIGQNYNVADFPDPISLIEEGNMAAVYQNGVFQLLGNVSTGGAARVTIRNGNGGAFAGGINVAGGELIWSFPISGTAEYRLQTTTVVNTTPQVPVPAAIWLFSSGLLMLAGMTIKHNNH